MIFYNLMGIQIQNIFSIDTTWSKMANEIS